MDFDKIQENFELTKKISADVIVKAINIELFMDSILVNYFVKCDRHSEFLVNFLTHPLMQVSIKYECLFDLFPVELGGAVGEKVRRLFNIRNTCAHAQPGISDQVPLIFSSKKKRHEDLSKLSSEFNKIYEEVFPILTKIIDELLPKQPTPL